MVAMAASSKENNPSCPSSTSASSAHHRLHTSSLRSPLSPIHHNSSCARPPEHPTLASRRPASANPSRAPLPSCGVKSPRNPPLPRSPNPTSHVCRRVLRDGAPTLDLATRFKTHQEKDRTPAAGTPRRVSSLQPCNSPQVKRQTQLFMQQKACSEPLFTNKSGSCNQRGLAQPESEKDEKPCRRKWRRYPRESVLKFLRGGDGQESVQGHAATGVEGSSSNTNTCRDQAQSSPKEAALPRETAPHGKGESFQQLSFNVYAGGKFSTGTRPSECVRVSKEAQQQEALASLPCQKTKTSVGSIACISANNLTINTADMPTPGSPNFPHDEQVSSALSPPPPDRSLSLTPPAERSLTPPMQPTQSPDFVKREGPRTLLPIDGICYAAPSALVKDKRKCKPRGVLTVDAGHEILSSAESELGFVLQQSTQIMPTPAVASVEWMLDEKKNLGDVTSPGLVLASTDLCRMSFPRFSLAQNEIFSQQIGESSACEDLEYVQKLKQQSLLQASFSISGYDWEASSSQGLFSSYHTEINSANPRRSIVFDNDEDVDKNQANFKSSLVHNSLFEEASKVKNPCMDFSDDESSDCFSLRGASPVEGSPPFEYSLLSSLEGMDTTKVKQRSWSQSSPDEVMLSMSGPTDSSLSSQEHENESKCNTNSIVSAACNNGGSLVRCKGGVENFMQRGKHGPYDTAPCVQQDGGDISSRLAMAKFLCNITATYLDDIATSLGKDRAGVGFERGPSREAFQDVDTIRLEHSALVVGRNKMAECCSLLRGLTLETSKSREDSGMASECSVNQPSSSLNEDTADSLEAYVHTGHNQRVTGRLRKQVPSLGESLEDHVDLPKAPHVSQSSCPSMKVPWPAIKAEVGARIPNKRFVAFVAVSYLLAGLFVISHTYQKRVKQAAHIM